MSDLIELVCDLFRVGDSLGERVPVFDFLWTEHLQSANLWRYPACAIF
jgi:hypothetical protein